MSYTLYDVIQDRSSINNRIETLNDFVFVIEEDVPRYLYISGFRSLFLFQTYTVDNRAYIDDVNLRFNELYFNGTLNGNQEDIMDGAKFEDMQDVFSQFASKVNANVSFSEPVVYLEQVDPWNINIVFESDVIIKDLGDLAIWNKTLHVEKKVPIEDFEDPIYLISTGQVTNKIVKSPYDNSTFVIGGDISNFEEHVENSYYLSSESAPSYLNRLEGNFSSDENGIESFVYLPELSAQGVSVNDKSCVDYVYFSSDDPVDYSISGMPSWFGVDDENSRLDLYGLRGLEN